MKSRSAEVAALASQLEPTFREYAEIAAVYIFGSVARGTASGESDVDFGLLLHYGRAREDAHRRLGDLAARLETATAPRRVDLVVLEDQGAVFCHEVLLEGHLIYEGHRDRRIDFESDTIARALDFRPTLELANRGHLAGYRRWLRDYRDRAQHPAFA